MPAGVQIDVQVEVGSPLVDVAVTGLGATGPAGTGGGGGGDGGTFEFEQDIASAVWDVVHSLAFFPNVTTVDTLEREMVGTVTYVDDNELTITFATPVTGKAYLS